jgi:vacuolar protein sorting-associated protein 35
LSNLEGVSLEVYKTKVLPQILEIIQNCKDSISQQYLMDCVIQAFPDDFHLNTLQILLEATTNLQTSVDVKVIIRPTFMHSKGDLHQFDGQIIAICFNS